MESGEILPAIVCPYFLISLCESILQRISFSFQPVSLTVHSFNVLNSAGGE